jgi:hypothetical protein
MYTVNGLKLFNMPHFSPSYSNFSYYYEHFLITRRQRQFTQYAVTQNVKSYYHLINVAGAAQSAKVLLLLALYGMCRQE